MFVDVVEIVIKAGNGGHGAVSFLRDKYTATGGPDGGNGGRGGSVIFVPDSNLSTLSNFRYKKKFFAQNGQNGASGKKSGKKGEDLIIKVPHGTIIKDISSDKIICDVSLDQEYIVAQGGRGGAGNMNFASSIKQSPRFAKPGEETQELRVKLELKLLADVALVGYPNVGKSTIISICSEAKPQIANYHFTTLSPILGVVKYDNQNSFVMADIPGLIEGAWQGVGLGHQFLRHIERCRMLLHVVDVSGSEGRDPCEDFDKINHELEKFNPDLINRPMLVVGNKTDLASEEQISKFENYIKSRNYNCVFISAASQKNIKKLLDIIIKKLSDLPGRKIFEPEISDVFEQEIDLSKIEIKKINNVYYVNSPMIKKLVNSVNFKDYDSMMYFQNFITKSGVTELLKNSGVKPGDTVSIDEMEFEFFD